MSGNTIRVGIGGWTFEPWRGVFYPPKWPQKRELEYASRRMTAIEVNGTFYRTQPRASFERWRDETPEGFVFAVKALRYTTHRRALAEAGDSIDAFMDSGVLELGPKLGPILWQFPPTRRYEREPLERFVELLPRRPGLRHVLDVRHESFRDADYIDLLRRHGIGTVYTDSPDYPSIPDLTSDLAYARLMRSAADCPTGYAPAEIDAWAQRVRRWAQGGEPDDLERVAKPAQRGGPRDVFVFMINGAKERAPAAAQALLTALGLTPPGDGNPP